MKSIVNYIDRGEFGNNKYRGNYSGKLLIDLQKVYKFDSFSDYMAGGFTAKDVSKYLNIGCNAYDLNSGFDLMNDDIKERNKFIMWHPPYWDIIRYSGEVWGDMPHPSDLSQIKDYDEFIRAINHCLAKQFASLKVGGKMAILMADVRRKGKLYSMLLDMMKIGTIQDIIIKTQNNVMSSYKEYANKNFVEIAHEYVLVLRKDNPYLYQMKITKSAEIDIRDSNIITWKDLVASVIEKLGGTAKLQDIYSEIAGHKKTKENNNWEEKIRQTLGRYRNVFKSEVKGVWQVAA